MSRYLLCSLLLFAGLCTKLLAESFLKNEEREWRLQQEEKYNLNLEAQTFSTNFPFLFQQSSNSPIALESSLVFTSASEKNLRFALYGDDNHRIFYSASHYGAQGFELRNGRGLASIQSAILNLDQSFRVKSKTYFGSSFRKQEAWYHIEDLYAEMKIRRLIVTIGRSPLYWGQSFVSPFGLSDNATSLNQLKLSTESLQLPWIFSSLGYFSADAVVSRMGANRVPQHDWFTAFRLSWKPTDFLEFNSIAQYQFAGDGIKKESLLNYFIEFLGARRDLGPGVHQTSDASNRAVMFDNRILLQRWGIPLSIYSEHHIEDCCGEVSSAFFRKSYSYTVGALYSLSPRQHFRFEYSSTGDALYFHSHWPSAASNDGRLVGHPLGRDSRGFYLLWRFIPREYLDRIDWGLAYELRGLTGRMTVVTNDPIQEVNAIDPSYNYETTEKRWRIRMSVEKNLGRFLSLFASSFMEQIQNRQNQRNQDDTGYGISFEISYRFSGNPTESQSL